jgi:hypothetical protein
MSACLRVFAEYIKRSKKDGLEGREQPKLDGFASYFKTLKARMVYRLILLEIILIHFQIPSNSYAQTE